MNADSEPVIVDAYGRAVVPSPRDPDRCPCGAGAEDRVDSCGFGEPHDVCQKCGHDFESRVGA